jgi:cytochrome P450
MSKPRDCHFDADFNAPEVIADPFPTLAKMRETAPAHRNRSLKGWCLTRYDDVCRGLVDKRFSAARIQPFLENQSGVKEEYLRELGAVFLLWLPFLDPPAHTRLRKLLRTGFSGRAIAGLAPKIAAIVDDLVAQFGGSEEIDIIEDFASPLPGTVIADVLGVPRTDVGKLKLWSDDIAAFILDSRLIANKYAVAASATAEMRIYFSELIERRRSAPGDAVIDELIAAHDGDDQLSMEELLSSCVLLLFAGHETTTQLFGNGTLALLRAPEQLADLSSHLEDVGVVANAVEEMLRWDGPSVVTVRVLTEPVELHDQTMAPGARVHLFIGAANRDPRLFEQPDDFDIRRANARKHINFGYGTHLCLGARLARMEATIAFPILLRALGNAELASNPLEWSDSLVVRGLKSLSVRRT